jgi:tetratricopeptide (TPR) repeat protein
MNTNANRFMIFAPLQRLPKYQASPLNSICALNKTIWQLLTRTCRKNHIFISDFSNFIISKCVLLQLPDSELDFGLFPEGDWPIAAGATGLPARVLLGWMEQEQAVKFLLEDCLFSSPLTERFAAAVWASRKAIVETLPRVEVVSARGLALSAADLKAARKFRSQHPEAESVVDFVRLNPLDLIIHQHWISTAISDRYRDVVTADKWLRTALLDPPSSPGMKSRREGSDIVLDLPHSEFGLAGPFGPDGQMRISEVKGFVTVAFHADRALLMTGYHRTYACGRYIVEAPNAPHGVLFGVSNQLALMGDQADDVFRMMERPRPPRMKDLFDDRLFLPVTLRKRKYQMRIHYEIVGLDADQGQSESEPFTKNTGSPPGLYLSRDAQKLFDEARRNYEAARIADAVALYQRALFLRPDFEQAHNNLGIALAAQGRTGEAITHYERAIAINPRLPGAHINLGVVLAAEGDPHQALEHYRRALELDPNHAEAHNNLGNLLKHMGRFDDAVAHYQRAVRIRPDYAEAYFNRAELKTYHRDDADLAALDSLAVRDDLPVNPAICVQFAMAKAFDDIGDYARSFEHLSKGNALKRRQIEYDEEGTVKLLERISKVFDNSFFDRIGVEGNYSSVPIFVVGMPRSGSTLIEQILTSHPDVQGAGEVRELEAAINDVARTGNNPGPYPECVLALDGMDLRRIGQAYLLRLQAPAAEQIRVTDKMPGNFAHIGLIRKILPNARIVHTVRNPMDTCFSCYAQLFTRGIDYSYDLAEMGRYYRAYTDLMAHWRSVLPSGGMLDVVYEDVLDDPEGQARRLLDYCGLTWDSRCLDFHRNSRTVKTASAVQVRKPLFRSSVQRWRRYEPWLAPLMKELEHVVAVDAPIVRTMAAQN